MKSDTALVWAIKVYCSTQEVAYFMSEGRLEEEEEGEEEE